ncbi:mucin-3A isoform X3 [Labeo rohita]|uniref:Mucin-3A isoform X3 n=1 Tax=Labeo rohita TaxID=84645 RepID=A0A498MY56_LABRO|nr:mucin-3A isoform X3 [Labeo rohita]
MTEISGITSEIKRTVKVAIEVNEIFKTEYANTSSKEYKEFVNRFETIIKVYNDSISAKFEVVKIILRPGKPLKKESGQRTRRSVPLEDTEKSVNVTHDMVFEMENSGSIDTTYNNLAIKVQEVLSSLENNTAIDFNVSDVSKATTKLNVASKLILTVLVDHYKPKRKKKLGLKGNYKVQRTMQRFYYSYIIYTRYNNRSLDLISPQYSNCFFIHHRFYYSSIYTKYNYRSCRHEDNFWYLGDRCSLQVYKTGFYAGLGTVAGVAVIIVALMTAYLILNKRTMKRNKDIKQDLVKDWLEDDFEWPPQKIKSHTDENGPTSHAVIF